MSDGVALTSARHPPSEQLIEAVARKICIAAMMDPDGLYRIAEREGPLWRLKRKVAIDVIFTVWDAEPLDAELDPDSIVVGEITIVRPDPS